MTPTYLQLKHYSSIYFFVRWQNNFGKLHFYCISFVYTVNICIFVFTITINNTIMKTTKQEIKDRLMNDDCTLTDSDAQSFVDDLFPDLDMYAQVETTDDE